MSGKKKKKKKEESSEFEYCPNDVSFKQGSYCPTMVPYGIKKGELCFDISPLLPSGIKFDTSTGCIHGITTSKTVPGKYEFTITCSADSSVKTGKASINIEKQQGVPCDVWISQGSKKRTNQIIGVANKTIEPAKIQITGVGIITKYQLMFVEPYNGSLPDGIEYDNIRGTFEGTPSRHTKASFQIEACLDGGDTIKSNTFVLTIDKDKVEKPQLLSATDIKHKMDNDSFKNDTSPQVCTCTCMYVMINITYIKICMDIVCIVKCVI